MNPEVITSSQWVDITTALFWMWGFVASMIIFAASLLASHGLIPSLVSTHDISARFQSIRPALYGLAVIAFAFAVFCLANFIMNVQVVYDIYQKVWI